MTDRSITVLMVVIDNDHMPADQLEPAIGALKGLYGVETVEWTPDLDTIADAYDAAQVRVIHVTVVGDGERGIITDDLDRTEDQ